MGVRHQKGASLNPERDALILKLREQQWSYRRIGRMVELTGERVRRIVKREKAKAEREKGE